MSKHVYDDAHVVISRTIGRLYNNPLGEGAFPLLARLVDGHSGPVRVLDVGCGRGRSSLWWARQGAQVTAFDPSAEMLEEARLLLEQEGLLGAVTLACTDLAGFRAERPFDLILVHDVLCYSTDLPGDVDRILAACRPGAVVSISNYFGEASAPSVVEIADAWGIETPLSYEAQEQLFEARAGRVLLLTDTTRRYRSHWAEMRRRLDRHEQTLTAQVGAEAVRRFERQIGTIEQAVESRRFGHLWALLEA